MTTTLATALAKAQSEMSNAAFNKVNPHFKNKYADLAAIRDAVMPALNKHGLALVQMTAIHDGAMTLVTRILHESGEIIESQYPLPMAARPQELGSALTYARRYSMAAICGIAAEEDDDGNTAEEGAKKSGMAPKPAMRAPVSPPPTAAPSGAPRLIEVTTDVEGSHMWADWGKSMAAAIKGAASAADVDLWMRENSVPLANLEGVAPKMAGRIKAIAADRIAALTDDLPPNPMQSG